MYFIIIQIFFLLKNGKYPHKFGSSPPAEDQPVSSLMDKVSETARRGGKSPQVSSGLQLGRLCYGRSDLQASLPPSSGCSLTVCFPQGLVQFPHHPSLAQSRKPPCPGSIWTKLQHCSIFSLPFLPAEIGRVKSATYNSIRNICKKAKTVWIFVCFIVYCSGCCYYVQITFRTAVYSQEVF